MEKTAEYDNSILGCLMKENGGFGGCSQNIKDTVS